MLLKWLAALLIGAVVAAGWSFYKGLWALPDRWHPWAVLRIEEELHWLTRHKLERLSRDPAQCLAVLGTVRMRWQPVAGRRTDDDCGFSNAVRIEETQFKVAPAFTLSCPAAVSLALWEKHVVLPAAMTHLKNPVAQLEHFGSYACRNVNHAAESRRSQHASADALDIAAFVLDDGSRISVLRAWDGDRPESAFLREVHLGACRVFDGVLGPDYNAAHKNHFHLDRGAYRVCR